MIIINPKGGLGNILFILCNGYSLSKENNMKLIVNFDYMDKRKNVKEYKMFKNFKFIDRKFLSILKNVNVYREPEFKYNKPTIISDKINYIDGYFQSYKYFLNNVKEIKDLIFNNLKDEFDEMKNNYNEIKNNKNTVLIHFRRGDYVNLNDIHPVQELSYYQKSLELITKEIENIKLVVFSDDINYVKKLKFFNNYDTYFVTEEDPEKSFILMSMCDNFIIANSSMSLLAYYFRDNKDAICCAPAKWFGDKGPKYEIDDILENRINKII
jgi:hypothetical protein